MFFRKCRKNRNIYKPFFIELNMVDKDIRLTEETHRKLMIYKYKLGAKNIEDVIKALIKISTDVKLASELNKNRKNE